MKKAQKLVLVFLFAFSGVLHVSAGEENPTEQQETFGAQPNPTGEPIGGGKGYGKQVLKGDFLVKNLEDLLDALAKAKAGQVIYVDDDAIIDLRPADNKGQKGPTKNLVIPGGVTLASGRGRDGSYGGLFYTWDNYADPLFVVGGEGVRITGIRLSGPDPERRLLWQPGGKTLFSSLGTVRGIVCAYPGLEVDNCELLGWSHSAIYLMKGASNAHIHHNFIHHNQRATKGYGIFLHEADQALIEANLFNWCRHCISGSGLPGTSFEARYNVVLDWSSGQSFDMQGGRDRNDGTEIAGDWVKIHHNTFRADDFAVVIRGRPSQGAEIHHNWFVAHPEQKKAIRFWMEAGYEEHWIEPPPDNAEIHDNLFGRDHPQGVRIPSIVDYYRSQLAVGVRIGEEIFGAEANPTGEPIGGGEGYGKIVTKYDYLVKTPKELLDALAKAKAGQVVYIDGEAKLDLTADPNIEDRHKIVIPGGVTLASDRGLNGSDGGLIFITDLETSPRFEIGGEGVRITGLRLSGPDPERRTDQVYRLGQEGKYYWVPTCDGIRSTYPLEVDNCEFLGWSHAAVYLMKGASKSHIHHNFFHHNQRHGLGYGVCVNEADYVIIEANLFNWQRHHIAATGAPGTGYEARYNIILEWGQNHSFDMHGGVDRGDGTEVAGERIKVHHNTFRSHVNSIVIRGRPLVEAEVHHNWFARQNQMTDAVRFWLEGARPPDNAKIYRNLFGRKRKLVE